MTHPKLQMRWFVLALAVLWFQGCALQSPPYSPSIANVDAMKKSGMRSVVLGSFTVTAGMEGASSIGLRGNPMSSSVGSDYAAYLKEALRQELVLAGKLDAKADLEVGATLIKNDIAAAGIATNSGEIEARFVVRQGGATRYDAVKRSDATWESSFVGGIAIPKAQQQYPLLIQQLVARLLADPAFVAALK